MLSSGASAKSIASRLGRGLLAVGGFAIAQAVAQALGLVTGFLIVRGLDKHNYALYTLTISGINALAMLSNGGIVDATTAIGARAWQDARHIGQVIVNAMRFRRVLAATIVVPVVGSLAWLLAHNGGHLNEIVVLCAVACVAAYYQLSGSILAVALRLKSEIARLRNLDLIGALLRAAAVAVLFTALNAEIAASIAAASAAAIYFLTRRAVAPLVELDGPPAPQVLTQIRGIVRRQWFNDLAFILQGQIVLLLLGFFGGSESVANFGALGRIAALFGVVTAVMQSVVIPRYARCETPHDMRRLYLAILLGSIAVAGLPVAVALLAPEALLWVLGAQYTNLPRELVLVILSAGTSSVGFVTWGLNSVRAWIIPPWINVPFFIVCQALLMRAIGVSTMEQVLWVGIAWYSIATVFHVGATIVFSRAFTRTS